jgi:hypothetical protein
MMKKLLITAIVCCITSITIAQATVEVYESDGKTAFDGRDIMVGTKLTFVVSLDSTDYWSGGLFITGDNRFLGKLIGRDYDPSTSDFTGSHSDSAGKHAKVTSWNDSEIWGYDLYGSDVNNFTGDWFIIDYQAIGPGDPNVWFCDYGVSWDNPVSFETFTQVPSRDFNNDGIVDYSDFSIFNTYWLSDNCSDPNWCDGTDINTDGIVNADDLILFADFWFWEAEYPAIPDDPHVPEPVPGPDFIYSLVDANGLDEITLTIGESVTLYIDMEMTDSNNTIYVFDAEVNISDPNLGSIDNTEYPSGTAQILVGSRGDEFNYWGPGDYQQQGIQFIFVSLGTPIPEGNLASFEYTCQTTGDVILELINPGTINIQYKEMLIHQAATASQSQSMSMQPDSMSTQQSVSDNEDNVEFLERVWINEKDIRRQYTQDEWDAFVESVRNAE